jgi:hypothetical protein
MEKGIHIRAKFLDDVDDSYRHIENKGVVLDNIPRVGECVLINGYYHRVKEIAYDLDTGNVELYLGKSTENVVAAA